MSLFNIGYLIFYVRLVFVATLVKYFRFMSNIFGLCLIFYVFVKFFGALYNLLGLCIVRRGFV